MSVTASQVQNALKVILTVGEIIREVKEIPSGRRDAQLMEKGIGMNEYERIIQTLTKAGAIRVDNNLIKWVAK